MDEDWAAKTLIRLLKVYTPPGSESKLHKTLREVCSEIGFRECYVDDVGNFFASYGRGRTLLLASHLDTVPGAVEAFYDEGEKVVRGRGAVDAKGPLLSYILGASLAMEKADLKVVVGGLVREELDGLGAKHLVESGFKADYVLVGEPTGFGIAIAYRGSVTAEIRSTGKGGHSSAPYIGDSALDKLLDFLYEFRSRFGGRSYGEITSAITMLSSGDWPSKLPENARACVNVRFPKPYSPDQVLKALRELSEKHGVELRIIDETPPVEARISTRLVRALMRGCIRNGIKPRIVKKTGTSDMNVLARLTDNIAAFGPGDSKLAHTRFEKISPADILKAARIISSTIIELSKRTA